MGCQELGFGWTQPPAPHTALTRWGTAALAQKTVYQVSSDRDQWQGIKSQHHHTKIWAL